MKNIFFKIFFLGSFLFVGSDLFAQVDSAKAALLKGQLIDSICGCISKADPSTVKTVDDMQNLMLNCSSAGNIQIIAMEYLVADGVNIADEQKVTDAMTTLSMDLAVKCPAMMPIIMNISKDSTQLNKVMDQYNQMQSTPSNNKTAPPKNNL